MYIRIIFSATERERERERERQRQRERDMNLPQFFCRNNILSRYSARIHVELFCLFSVQFKMVQCDLIKFTQEKLKMGKILVCYQYLQIPVYIKKNAGLSSSCFYETMKTPLYLSQQNYLSKTFRQWQHRISSKTHVRKLLTESFLTKHFDVLISAMLAYLQI